MGTSSFNGKLQLALTPKIHWRNVADFVDKSPIGVDYDQENKLSISSRWVAERVGAPPHSPREAQWVRSSNLATGECFFHFLNSFWRCVHKNV